MAYENLQALSVSRLRLKTQVQRLWKLAHPRLLSGCSAVWIPERSSGGPLANFQNLCGPVQQAFEFTRFEGDSSGFAVLNRRDFPCLAQTHRFAIPALHDHM